MSLLEFTTDRMQISDWEGAVANPERLARLQSELTAILTPAVLAPLPPPLWLGSKASAVEDWIEARRAEGAVTTIRSRKTDELLGLLIAALEPEKAHIGYLFAQAVWGQGLATELLIGLTDRARETGPGQLIGGVASDNAASARVLQKAGFERDAELSNHDTDMFVWTAADR